jgi:hypothetical protein
MRHQPALEPAEEGPAARAPRETRSEALCLMPDGSWQLMKVLGWQLGAEGRWRCLLQWGVWGTVHTEWFVHDPHRLIPINRPLFQPMQHSDGWKTS